MKKIIRIHQENPVLFVYWHLTDFCNYKCNYCPAFLNAGWYANGDKPGFPTDGENHIFIDRLTSLVKDRSLMLILSGGEPTVHPMFPEIIIRTKPLGTIGIVTNGSRPLNWWKKLPALPHSMTISLHPEYVKMDHINQLSEYLVDQGVLLTYNLSVDPKNWDLVKAMHAGLDPKFRHRIRYKILHEFSDNSDKKIFNYTQEQLDWVKENFDQENMLFTLTEKETIVYYDDGSISNGTTLTAELTMDKENSFYNWKCSAGSNGLKVSVNGNVYGGICAMQKLGHMTNFELLTEPLTCKIKYCAAPGDIRLPKYDPTFKDNEQL